MMLFFRVSLKKPVHLKSHFKFYCCLLVVFADDKQFFRKVLARFERGDPSLVLDDPKYKFRFMRVSSVLPSCSCVGGCVCACACVCVCMHECVCFFWKRTAMLVLIRYLGRMASSFVPPSAHSSWADTLVLNSAAAQSAQATQSSQSIDPHFSNKQPIFEQLKKLCRLLPRNHERVLGYLTAFMHTLVHGNNYSGKNARINFLLFRPKRKTTYAQLLQVVTPPTFFRVRVWE